MKPLLVSSGEPAGIGPDLCLALAERTLPIVVLGDKSVLKDRAEQLGKTIKISDYQADKINFSDQKELMVLDIPCPVKVTPGLLEPANVSFVLNLLKTAVDSCQSNEFSALITAPINKTVINQAGIPFRGHTEFLANHCHVESVVMMLACAQMKVALVTTHLPLKQVASSVTREKIQKVITCLNYSLQQDFGLSRPKICVAGLNPHAGESGYLGREEIDIVIPALTELKHEGIDILGPLPADTMFTPKYNNTCDAFVAMYHDQGLPVLKYAGFGHSVNITLGLPIIRTSVDHGTALDLAGKGVADPGSLNAAVDMAITMVKNREKTNDKNKSSCRN